MRIRYKKTFLNKVIARVDFPFQIEALIKQVPSSVNKLLLTKFPIQEQRKVIAAKLMIGGEQIKDKEALTTHWFYHGKLKTNRAVVAPDHFLVEYDVYDSFEELCSHFLPVLEELFKSIDQFQVSRVGLRYIDHITINDGDMFDWSYYLHPSLLASFSIPHNDKKILRTLNNFVVGDEDMILQFNYGMHNPDFPAPIKKKMFILDSDAYARGLLEFGDIKNKLEKFHKAIGELFELVITDGLRTLMGVIHGE